MLTSPYTCTYESDPPSISMLSRPPKTPGRGYKCPSWLCAYPTCTKPLVQMAAQSLRHLWSLGVFSAHTISGRLKYWMSVLGKGNTSWAQGSIASVRGTAHFCWCGAGSHQDRETLEHLWAKNTLALPSRPWHPSVMSWRQRSPACSLVRAWVSNRWTADPCTDWLVLENPLNHHCILWAGSRHSHFQTNSLTGCHEPEKSYC